jgi:hypothetical protein
MVLLKLSKLPIKSMMFLMFKALTLEHLLI